MFKARRVFYCANQISLIIAVNYAQQEMSRAKTIILYDPLRCDISPFGKHFFIPFSRLNFVILILKNIFYPPIEVCVPHLKIRQLARFYAKSAKKLSIVDDGLDTFRESPTNVVLSEFKNGTNFYTFDYEIRLASWLNNFNKIKVCSLDDIAKSSRKKIDLNNYDYVLVESPGIETAILPDFSSSKVLLVKHINPKKNLKLDEDLPSVLGVDFALEASIKSFQGTLIVGESMVAVYALQLKSPKFKLLVAIHENRKNNLASFVDLVNKNAHAKMLSSKGDIKI